MTRTFFFFNDTATTEIYTLSLHDALPILAYVALQVEVDARMEWSSGHRQQRRRGARLADDVSQRAHLDEAEAVAAPQRVVVLALQAVLADQPGVERARGKAPLAALRLRHLAQVPDQMRDERTVRIEALGLGLDQQPGEHEPPLLEGGDDLERRVR